MAEPDFEISDAVGPSLSPSIAKLDRPEVGSTHTTEIRAIETPHTARHVLATRSRGPNNTLNAAKFARDDLLLVLAFDRVRRTSHQDAQIADDRESDDHPVNESVHPRLTDDPLSLALDEW